MSLDDVAFYALLAGFCVATWRKDQRWRDGWWCAFGILLIVITRFILNPHYSDGVGMRLLSLIGGLLWLGIVIGRYSRSGIPCWHYGHVWATTVVTAGGHAIFSTEGADPETERQLAARFADVPHAQVSSQCAVCRRPRPDGEPPTEH